MGWLGDRSSLSVLLTSLLEKECCKLDCEIYLFVFSTYLFDFWVSMRKKLYLYPVQEKKDYYFLGVRSELLPRDSITTHKSEFVAMRFSDSESVFNPKLTLLHYKSANCKICKWLAKRTLGLDVSALVKS